MNWQYADKNTRCFACGKPIAEEQLVIPFESNVYCSDGCYSVRITRQEAQDQSRQCGYAYNQGRTVPKNRQRSRTYYSKTEILETPLPAFTRINANEYRKY